MNNKKIKYYIIGVIIFIINTTNIIANTELNRIEFSLKNNIIYIPGGTTGKSYAIIDEKVGSYTVFNHENNDSFIRHYNDLYRTNILDGKLIEINENSFKTVKENLISDFTKYPDKNRIEIYLYYSLDGKYKMEEYKKNIEDIK